MNNTCVLASILIVLALPALATAGPGCGATVSGKVILDGDLNCTDSNGLIIGADNTTIDLNGHSISCAGPGYLGSCQGRNKFGITVWEKNNVTIKGPGKIDGFTVGIWLQNTLAANVRNLEVTGPASPGFGINPRVDSAGILLQGAPCPADGVSNTANIQANKVTNHRLGIFLLYSGCATVGHNQVSSNNSDIWMNSWGILLGQVTNTTVVANVVERNGDNLGPAEGGIGIGGADAKNNVVTNNLSSNNCGDGIQLNGANPGNNVVANNVARGNGASDAGGKCKVPTPGMFFDISQRWDAAGNKVNQNNQCETQTGPVPAGVCNPGE